MRKKKGKKGFILEISTPIKREEIISSINSIDMTKYSAYNTVRDFLKSHQIEKIYCLGLGDPINSLACRSQISFILSLAKELDTKNLVYYDPLLSSTSASSLIQLGFTLPDTEYNMGIYKAEKHTFFYMPHCPAFLYHNLIVSNLTPETFSNLIIFGNSFKLTAEQAKYDQEVEKTIAIDVANNNFMEEVELDFDNNMLFHNSSLMYSVDFSKLPQKDDEFWKNKTLIKTEVHM